MSSDFKVGVSEESEQDVMRRYFDLIHSQERVEYLMLQQDVIERVVSLESASENADFLADENFTIIKKRLNTDEGIKYYEHYLGQASKKEKPHHLRELTMSQILLHLAAATLITTAIVFVARFVYRYFNQTAKQAKVEYDCQ